MLSKFRLKESTTRNPGSQIEARFTMRLETWAFESPYRLVIVPNINSANIKLKLEQEFELLVQFSLLLITHHHSQQHAQKCVKDGASFCYCTYVLCISGYLGFLRNLPTNTTIFLHGLWLCGRSRPWQGLSESKKKPGGNHALFRNTWA